MPHAHASRIARAELEPLLQEIASHLRYVYIETATASIWSRYSDGVPLGAVERGRAFGPGCDVQFLRSGDGLRLTIIEDALPLPGKPGPTIDLGPYELEEVTFLLWGQYNPAGAAWIESGFRQHWQYPVQGHPARVGVRATEYRERSSGDLHFTRYHELIGIAEPE